MISIDGAGNGTKIKEDKPGLVHIYHGDGKGKTTAAIGLAVRASGRGMRVLILRLLKTDDSGEVDTLRQIAGITVIPCDRTFGFVSRMSDEQKKEAAEYYTAKLKEAFQKTREEKYDMLIVDEMMAACNYRMVPEQVVLDFLDHKPKQLEIVMTGRDPSEQLKQRADYITEMRMEQHPYKKGVNARVGIEY